MTKYQERPQIGWFDERVQFSIVEICVSISGTSLPPLLKFVCIRMLPELLDGTPLRTYAVCIQVEEFKVIFCLAE